MHKYQVVDIYNFKYKTLMSDAKYSYNDIVTGTDGNRYIILFIMEE